MDSVGTASIGPEFGASPAQERTEMGFQVRDGYQGPKQPNALEPTNVREPHQYHVREPH